MYFSDFTCLLIVYYVTAELGNCGWLQKELVTWCDMAHMV